MRKGKKGEAFVKDRILPFFLFCLSLLFLWNTPYLQAQQAAPPSPTKPPTLEQIRKAKDMLQQKAAPEMPVEKPGPPEAPKEKTPPPEKLEEKPAAPERPEQKPAPPEEAAPPEEKPAAPPEPMLSTFEAYIQKKRPLTVSTDIQQFGYELFEQPPSTFAPVDIFPVGPDYLLGTGDEIRIIIWGRVNAEYATVIDRDGKISLPKIGVIHLAGLTFAEAKGFLEKEFSRYYKRTQVKINISMGKLRSIRVFVVGKARKPGSYTLSSLSSLINALFVAAGPSKVGTMRDIQVKRNGKTIVHFDVYDFLLKGDKTKDIRLMPEDVIFIPTAGALVGIAGNVKSPAIYELKGETRLLDLLEMAGGVRATGYFQRVQVERIFENEAKVVLDLNLKKLSEKANLVLKDGDLVKIFSISPTITNPIELVGNFTRPGTYEWREGIRIRDLIEGPEDLLPDTFFEFALIERFVPPDYHKEYLSFGLGKLFFEGDEKENISLMPYDTIVVFNKWDLIKKEKVRVTGAVNKPGEYEYRPNMKLSDLLKLAGGLERYAYTVRAELIRVDLTQEEPRYRKIDIKLRKIIEEDPLYDVALQDRDHLIVKAIPEYGIKKEVELKGNVRNPGKYPWFEGMRLTDLIKPERQEEVFLPDTLFDYGLIERMVPPEYHKEYLAIYPGKVYLEGDMTANAELKPFDVVTILNKWDLKEKEKVTITGAVNKPGEYEYRPNIKLSDLLKLAGGLKRPDHLESYLPNGMIIRRMPPDFREETITFDFKKAFIEQEKEADLVLKPFDEVRVFDIWELAQKKNVLITGAVNNPGTFPWTQNMRISDLLKLAEGTKYFAYAEEAELTRVTPTPEGPKTERIIVNLEEAIRGDPQHDILLQEDDYLFVRTIPDWRLYRIVEIKGEVSFPGIYAVKKSERLSSVIRRAGGFTPEAYLKGAVFTRESAKRIQEERIKGAVDKLEEDILRSQARFTEGVVSEAEAKGLEQSMVAKRDLLRKLKAAQATGRVVIVLDSLDKFAGSKYDMELEDGDTLTILPMPWIVNVLGSVYNPTSIVYTRGKRADFYLSKVGGPTRDAEEGEMYIVKADGTVISKTQKGAFGLSWDSEGKRWVGGGFMATGIDPGDTILVPSKITRIVWKKELMDWTTILFQLAVTAGVIVALY